MPVITQHVKTPSFFFQKLINKFKRSQGPTLADLSTAVIMRVCALHLERFETRELAPVKGAFGPMIISGGAITKIVYRVFDKEADSIDPAIKHDPVRAYLRVTMILTLSLDPQFTTEVQLKSESGALEWTETKTKAVHSAPGLLLLKHLANYFPIPIKPHNGPTIAPEVA